MEKNYSFKKEKVIDIDAVEKTTVAKNTKTKLSFGEKLKIAGNKIQKATEKYNKYQEDSHNKNIAKLKKNVERTNLEAQLAKNKSRIEKFTKKKEKKNNDPFGFGGGFF